MCSREFEPDKGDGDGSDGKGDGGGLSTAAKLGVVTALLVALIGAAATVVAAMISNEPKGTASGPTQAGELPRMPTPTCPTCFTGGKTFTEQSIGGTPKPTFRDPRAFLGLGPAVPAGQRVEVVCRFHVADSPPSTQPGWWYLIASPPWNRQYYTVANSYLNGDTPGGAQLTVVDNGVPVC